MSEHAPSLGGRDSPVGADIGSTERDLPGTGTQEGTQDDWQDDWEDDWDESDEGVDDDGSPPLPRHPRRWWVARIGALVLLVVVDLAVVLVAVAARYQPLRYGGHALTSMPGAPLASGERLVNHFGGLTGQMYIPPQPGVFFVTSSIANRGTRAVSIRAISLEAPGDRARWPVVAAGPVRFRLSGAPAKFPTWSLTAPVELVPGQSFDIAVPVRFADACYLRSAWTGVDQLWIELRWWTFTHWVAVPSLTLIMHDPEPAAPAGLARPASLTCPRAIHAP